MHDPQPNARHFATCVRNVSPGNPLALRDKQEAGTMPGNRKIELDGIAERLRHEFCIESEPLSAKIASCLERLYEEDNRAATPENDNRDD